MTVAELIEKLKQQPQDALVCVCGRRGFDRWFTDAVTFETGYSADDIFDTDDLHWVDSLPERFDAVVIGDERFDAVVIGE